MGGFCNHYLQAGKARLASSKPTKIVAGCQHSPNSRWKLHKSMLCFKSSVNHHTSTLLLAGQDLHLILLTSCINWWPEAGKVQDQLLQARSLVCCAQMSHAVAQRVAQQGIIVAALYAVAHDDSPSFEGTIPAGFCNCLLGCLCYAVEACHAHKGVCTVCVHTPAVASIQEPIWHRLMVGKYFLDTRLSLHPQSEDIGKQAQQLLHLRSTRIKSQ